MIVEDKSSAAKAIWEEKNKLVEVMANIRSWNMDGWPKALAKLTRRHVNVIQDPTEKKKIKEEEKKEIMDTPAGVIKP